MACCILHNECRQDVVWDSCLIFIKSGTSDNLGSNGQYECAICEESIDLVWLPCLEGMCMIIDTVYSNILIGRTIKHSDWLINRLLIFVVSVFWQDLLYWTEADLQTVGVTNPAHRARLASNLVFIRDKLRRSTNPSGIRLSYSSYNIHTTTTTPQPEN